MTTRPILLAAGGTGGHLFPAHALAAELGRRGLSVELVTDRRVSSHLESFPARAVHAVGAATFTSRAPAAVLQTGGRIGAGLLAALTLIRRIRPRVVVGFGGYPTVPPLLAAQMLHLPTVVHEQNGVLGRANRLLAARASAVATGFAHLALASPRVAARAVHVGNPVRPEVISAAEFYAPPDPEGEVRLVAFGGSQGARVMSEIVPSALGMLENGLRKRIHIVHQARSEDAEEALGAYAVAGVAAEIAPFFRDLPVRMARAHLVIARAGASTVAELGVLGRPAVLVPLPHSLDQDQLANARALEAAGGATVIMQSDLTATALSGLLARLLADPAGLAAAAAASRSTGMPDAAARLADLVLGVARAV